MDNMQTSLAVNASHPSLTTIPQDVSAVPTASGDHFGTCATTLAPNRIISLPPEIRIMLYRTLFDIDRRFPPVFASAVSKEIRLEALPVFFKDLGLEILIGFQEIPGKRLTQRLGGCLRRRVRPAPDNHKPDPLRARLYSRIGNTPVVEVPSPVRWARLSVIVDDFLDLWGRDSECLFDYLQNVEFLVLNPRNNATCEVHLCCPSDGRAPTVEVKFSQNKHENRYICMLQVMLETEISLWSAREGHLRFFKDLYGALVRHVHHYQMSLWLNNIADKTLNANS